MACFTAMPNEILNQIFLSADTDTLAKLARVAPRFNQILNPRLYRCILYNINIIDVAERNNIRAAAGIHSSVVVNPRALIVTLRASPQLLALVRIMNLNWHLNEHGMENRKIDGRYEDGLAAGPILMELISKSPSLKALHVAPQSIECVLPFRPQRFCRPASSNLIVSCTLNLRGHSNRFDRDLKYFILENSSEQGLRRLTLKEFTHGSDKYDKTRSGRALINNPFKSSVTELYLINGVGPKDKLMGFIVLWPKALEVPHHQIKAGPNGVCQPMDGTIYVAQYHQKSLRELFMGYAGIYSPSVARNFDWEFHRFESLKRLALPMAIFSIPHLTDEEWRLRPEIPCNYLTNIGTMKLPPLLEKLYLQIDGKYFPCMTNPGPQPVLVTLETLMDVFCEILITIRKHRREVKSTKLNDIVVWGWDAYPPPRSFSEMMATLFEKCDVSLKFLWGSKPVFHESEELNSSQAMGLLYN